MTTKNPIVLAALAASALALGACGSSKDDNSGKPGQSQEDKAYAGALKFAKCMRDEGIEMPDPQRQANGGIVQSMGAGKGEAPPNEAKLEAAQKRCEHFMDTGGGGEQRGDPAQEAEHRKALLAYAKCMRGHGVPMPDPQFEGDKVKLQIGGPAKGKGGPNPESPAFKAAEKACQPILAKLGMDGGPGTTKAGG